MTKTNGHNVEEHSSPIEFPCDFIIKVMGKTEEGFEKLVLDIIQKEFPDIKTDDIKKRPSKEKNYIALTVTVYAESKEQLDRVYKD